MFGRYEALRSRQRQELYEALGRDIGNTPLVPYTGSVPNGNRIWIKRECDDPFGSHYDRVFLDLFRHYEERGVIKPGDKVLETSSGMAGVSFSGIGRELGYKCIVMIPEGDQFDERRDKLGLNCAERILTPERENIAGFTKERILHAIKEKRAFYMNHSMGRGGSNNDVTLKALEGIANEVAEKGVHVDCFVPAIGNGSTVLGPGRVLKKNGCERVVGFEHFQSAVAYEMMAAPGSYRAFFEIEPGELPPHRLPGTSYRGLNFPHIRSAVQDKVLDWAVLVSDWGTDYAYAKLGQSKRSKITNWAEPQWLVHFKDVDMGDQNDLGNTSKAGIAVALNLASEGCQKQCHSGREELKDKNLLVIGYNKLEMDLCLLGGMGRDRFNPVDVIYQSPAI